MPKPVFRLTVAAIALLLVGATPAATDWSVRDLTDNDTGLRSVDATNLYIDDNAYLTLRMECTKGKPQFYVDWDGLPLSTVMVLTVSAADTPDSDPRETLLNFEKSDDPLPDQLRAVNPEAVVRAIGAAPYTVFIAHTGNKDPMIGLDTKGTVTAWNRVISWCPPRPAK